jgi:hypothetical protein
MRAVAFSKEMHSESDSAGLWMSGSGADINPAPAVRFDAQDRLQRLERRSWLLFWPILVLIV